MRLEEDEEEEEEEAGRLTRRDLLVEGAVAGGFKALLELGRLEFGV